MGVYRKHRDADLTIEFAGKGPDRQGLFQRRNPSVWLESSHVTGCWPHLDHRVIMLCFSYNSRKVVCVRGKLDGDALSAVRAPLMENPL